MNTYTIIKPLLACSLLLALAACAKESPTAQPSSSSSSDGPVASPSPTATPEVVDAAGTSPRRPKGAPTQGSCSEVAGGVDLCSDHSGQRFALRWTNDAGASWRTEAFDLRHLLLGPAPSLAPGVLTAVGGGDGATLLPFEVALRSQDLGETWQTFELPRFDGQMAYVAGSVVTADGRLLSLLTYFSDDRPGWEADRHHGVYASDGADWSAYSPILPEFTPVLNPAPPGESALQELSATLGAEPSIRVRTWDDHVYVSTDDARTFREIAVR